MAKLEIAVFGGGCFWCTEAVFNNFKGVESVMSGYCGGTIANPSYEQVSSGTTGHTEAIKIEFDPSQIQFKDLLNVFFATHDPTTLNQQGNDIGTQYRSAIFYTNQQQKKDVQDFIAQLENDKTFEHPIVTQISAFDKFYEAEDYHQRYYERNTAAPYCQVVINPKIAKLRQKFSKLLKE